MTAVIHPTSTSETVTPAGVNDKPVDNPEPAPIIPQSDSPEQDEALEKAPDPYDLDRFRKNPNRQIVDRGNILTKVFVDKPPKGDFFHTFTEEEDWFGAFILDFKDGTAVHLLTPEVYDELTSKDEDTTKSVTLAMYVTKGGRIGLWPLVDPVPGKDQNSWHASAWIAAEEAKTGWTRIKSSQTMGCYIVQKSKRLDPVTRPKETMKQLIFAAFKGNIIDTMDHPLIKRLEANEE